MEELEMSETANREALDAEHIFMQDDIERWQYEQREKAVRDYISAMHASRDEGMELATLQNLKTLMKNMNLSAEKAMDALQISASKRQKYRALLHDS